VNPLNPLDPNNVPKDVMLRQQQLLQQRRWSTDAAEVIAEIKKCEAAAKEAFKNASMEAIAWIIRERNEAIASIRTEVHEHLDRIDNIGKLTEQRITAASLPPPPQAPIDLDEKYSEKDFLSASADSIIWVVSECRRVMVPHGLVFKVDYSRQSTKPPTTMAMAMVEHYAAHPDELDIERLCMRVAKLRGTKTAKPTVEETPRPKTAEELDDEEYMRRVGLLPPEGETP